MLKPQLKNSRGPSEGGVSKGQMLWKGRFQTPSHLFIFILNSRKWVILPRRRPRSWAGSRAEGGYIKVSGSGPAGGLSSGGKYLTA